MKETRNYYTTQNNYADHTTYGGELSLFDFEGHHTMQSMANRIAADLRFDKMCKQNALNRDRTKKLQKGTN